MARDNRHSVCAEVARQAWVSRPAYASPNCQSVHHDLSRSSVLLWLNIFSTAADCQMGSDAFTTTRGAHERLTAQLRYAQGGFALSIVQGAKHRHSPFPDTCPCASSERCADRLITRLYPLETTADYTS